MKSLFSWIMNLIVIALSVFAVLGHFFAPLWTIDLQLTLTPEIAEVLFPETENPTEEEIQLHLLKYSEYLQCK